MPTDTLLAGTLGNYVMPAHVGSVVVELWGGGNYGDDGVDSATGDGGGASGYAKVTLTLTTGASYLYIVGLAGSDATDQQQMASVFFDITGTVIRGQADGADFFDTKTPGSGSVGDVLRTGGAGGSSNGADGGGGGGSPTSAANGSVGGNAGVIGSPGVGGGGTGVGGTGGLGLFDQDGADGFAPGGGGGGGGGAGGGGDAGGGQIRITYTLPAGSGPPQLLGLYNRP